MPTINDLFGDFMADDPFGSWMREKAKQDSDPLFALATEMHKLIGAAKQVVTDLEQQTSSAR